MNLYFEMGDVEIPDDFYMFYGNLCSKNCLFFNGKYSNYRRVFTYGGLNNTHIDNLRSICNFYDEIEKFTYFINGKFTYFINGKFNNLKIRAHSGDKIEIYYNKYHMFKSLDEVLQYLRENHPESIKSGDIKIALKD